MSKVSEKDEIYDLWLLFMKAERCCFKAREKELLRYGITTEQAEILFIISEIGGGSIKPGEIARLTIREPQTVYTLVGRMEGKGLLKRSRDAKNLHLFNIDITDKGQEAYQRAKKAKTTKNIFSALDDKQKGQLRSILKVMIKAGKEEIISQYRPPYL